MFLDEPGEKMLRAIVLSALAEAAGGRTFCGKFHRYVISASRLHVDADGLACIEAKIVREGNAAVQAPCVLCCMPTTVSAIRESAWGTDGIYIDVK
jgi:hypothetical protein